MPRQFGIRSRINQPSSLTEIQITEADMNTFITDNFNSVIYNNWVNNYLLAAPPVEGQGLVWDSVNSKWISKEAVQTGFKDEFDDAEIFWAWKIHGTDANRVITEGGGKLGFEIKNNTNSRFYFPSQNNSLKAVIGIPACPCEIITRLSAFNDLKGAAGLWIGIDPINAEQDQCYGICRHNPDEGPPANGISFLTAHDDNGGIANVAVTDLPVWFKIRVNAISYEAVKMLFYYSDDGLAYTLLHSIDQIFSISGREEAGLVAGLMVQNVPGAYQNVQASFDFFHIIPITSP